MKIKILSTILSSLSIGAISILPLTSCNGLSSVKNVTVTAEVDGGNGTIKINKVIVPEFTPFANIVQMFVVTPNNGFKIDKWYNDKGAEIKNHYIVESDLHAKVKFVHNTFSEDTWSSVCEEADKGLENLKKVYGVESFLGLERNIKIGSKIYSVRVIGQEHDTIWDGQKEAGQAALTFESVNLLMNYEGIINQTKWDTENCHDFFNSPLQAWLEGTGKAVFDPTKYFTTSIKELISSSEPIVFNHIKMVVKQKYIYDGKSIHSEATDYYPRIFSPSQAELGWYSQYPKNEGTPYEFFLEQAKQKKSIPEARIKKDAKGKAIKYWTSSPNLVKAPDEKYKYAFSVGEDGNLVQETDITKESCGINFAFCI